VKRVIGGMLALAVMVGCGSSNSQQSAQAPAAGPAAPLGKDAQQDDIRQPMADETRPIEPRGTYHPVAVVEIPSDRVIARVNGQPITMGELQKPLVEGYGLRVLLFQTQLNLARQKAVEQKVTYTRADVDAEFERTMKVGFQDAPKEDYPALLAQLLERQGVSRAEFDMLIETNTILRRIAEPQLKDKITEDHLREAFNSLYGETAVVKHIQCANALEAQQAKMRLASGEKWEDVVRQMSRNPRTAAIDGELPPFSRSTTQWAAGWGKVPEGFKAWAFGGAKVGDISDPIQAEGAYHIVRMERKIQPKVVKYEDVKEGIRADLYKRLIDQGLNELRNQLGAMVKRAMVIEDPTLRRQYESKVAEQEKAMKEEERIRGDIKSRVRAATQEAATQPAGAGDSMMPTLSATRPSAATQPAPVQNPQKQGAPQPGGTTPGPQQASPAKAPAGEQPPATKSGGGPDSTKQAK
jgi:hypothetical protein